MRVLMAVDGSSASFDAVAQAGRLLSPARDRIVFYYSPPDIHLGGSAESDPHLIDRARAALAEAVFAEARDKLPAELRGNCENMIGSQRARHGIKVAADSAKADLIVVGARGLGPIQRVLIGSVSRGVVHESSVPVLVVRPQREASRPLKLLLATDSAAACERLAGVLNQFTWPAGAAGQIISIVPSMFAGEVPKWLAERARSADAEAMSRAWVIEHEAEIKTRQEEMVACGGRLPAGLQALPPLVAEGYPADKILEAAVREQSDLIVVGARALGRVSRVLLGSTSEAVLSHAACSVLVIPERERP